MDRNLDELGVAIRRALMAPLPLNSAGRHHAMLARAVEAAEAPAGAPRMEAKRHLEQARNAFVATLGPWQRRVEMAISAVRQLSFPPDDPQGDELIYLADYAARVIFPVGEFRAPPWLEEGDPPVVEVPEATAAALDLARLTADPDYPETGRGS